ncbi:MAG: LysM peptidoglycan-binding domain-containing protein [Gemmatimonadetes bacterium]|nr:LysM peptidoglycan-binding domain-containing protein [Gemmatimonadota bacterium]
MTTGRWARWLVAGPLLGAVASCASGGGAREAAPAPAPAPAQAPALIAVAPDTTTLANYLTPLPVVAAEEVEQEAERLFGQEGRALLEAAAAAAGGSAGGAARATFDIDVTSFAANRRVLEYLRFFQVDARDRFEIWLSRLGRYEGMIRARLRAKGLPEDLVYLTLIESGLSNTAVSRAKAVGMWQFIASTGRVYGLTIDPWVDERRDPYKATDAAVAHLTDLVNRLGSVYLAAAAYNAGAGRVERGINQLPGEAESLTDNTFFQLADGSYLRRETRDYVPKLIAASLIAKQPERYGFTDVVRLSPLLFDEISVPDATGLDVIARLCDTTVAAILELNPQFVRGVTPPDHAVTVRVPRGRGETAAVRYAVLPVTQRVTFVDHYVTRGETLSEIARRYRVSTGMIQASNPHLRPRALRIGQRIIIPMSGRVVPASAWSVAPEPRVRRVSGVGTTDRTYRVRAGDTPSTIARAFGVTLSALLNQNGLTMGSIIHPGELLRIPVRDQSGSRQ